MKKISLFPIDEREYLRKFSQKRKIQRLQCNNLSNDKENNHTASNDNDQDKDEGKQSLSMLRFNPSLIPSLIFVHCLTKVFIYSMKLDILNLSIHFF